MSLPLPIVLACLLGAAPLAHGQHRHVHGEGRLDVAIDRGTISISLELPLDAAVGFERAPKNDDERAALAEAERALRDAGALFAPSAAAGCGPGEVRVGMPKFDGGGHADIDADYVFACANPAALKGIETRIFTRFKRLQRLEVQRSGPRGQGSHRLTPKNPVLSW